MQSSLTIFVLLTTVGSLFFFFFIIVHNCLISEHDEQLDQGNVFKNHYQISSLDRTILNQHVWDLLQDEDERKAVFDLMDGIHTVTTLTEDDHYTKLQTTTQTFGYSDYDTKQTMKEDAHIPIASNTKLYTTVAIYQLHEQGLLDVDDDIATMLDINDFHKMGFPIWYRKFCPKISLFGSCQIITLRQLLSMSSGIYPTLNCNVNKNSKSCNPIPYIVNFQGSLAKMVGTCLREPLIFEPGTQFQYSNPNFILAAYFVEKYSGMTFREYLHINIFNRIGMNDSYYDYWNGMLTMDFKRPRSFVKYYSKQHKDSFQDAKLISVGYDTVQLDLGMASGTGGIVATADDERTFWYSLFLRNTTALLQDPMSLKSILSPMSPTGQGVLRWNNVSHPIWSYYSQGVQLLCLTSDCQDGGAPYSPRYIIYEGGTYTDHTANVIDLHHGTMTQVWTTTLLAFPPSPKSFHEVMDQQEGLIRDQIQQWDDAMFPSNIPLALWSLFEQNPPDDSISPMSQF